MLVNNFPVRIQSHVIAHTCCAGIIMTRNKTLLAAAESQLSENDRE